MDPSASPSSHALRLFGLTHQESAAPLDAPLADDVSSFEEAWSFARSEDPDETPYVVVATNRVLLNTGFADEVRSAITDPALSSVRWLSLISDGFDIAGRYIDQGNFLDDPATPSTAPLRAAGLADPAVSVIDVARLLEIDPADRATSFQSLIDAGNSAGLATLISSRLRFSYSGDRTEYLTRVAARSAGSISPADADWLHRVRPEPSIAVAVRTTASRRGLLRRNLVALAEANDISQASEVLVVSSDDQLDAVTAEASRGIDALALETVHVSDESVPSRVAAMTTALRAAQSEYVWFVDDDDWVTPDGLAIVKGAVHAADRPIIVGASNAFREAWADDTLAESVFDRHYFPAEWYRAFTGWNFLPVCSVVMPRELALERLSVSPLLRDLGEDYAMQLLLYTAPGATVSVADETIANVSLRAGGDNVVTMSDRGPWLRDLGSHVSDLSRDPMASTPALWALGRAMRDVPYPTEVDRAADVQAQPSTGDMGGIAPRAMQRARSAWKRLTAGFTG